MNKDSLSWSNQSTSSAVFTITNMGEEKSVLKWRTSSDSSRVRTEPASGTVAAGDDGAVVKVVIDNRSLEKEVTYAFTLRVTSNGGDEDISLAFEMKDEGIDRCGFYPAPTAQDLEHTDDVAPVTTPYVPGQLLVGLRTSTLAPQSGAQPFFRARSAAVAGDFGLNILQAASAFRPALLTVPDGENILETAERLMRDPRVAYAEPNYYLEPLNVAPSELDDPLLSQQWHLLEFGLEEAWERTTGSEDVVIAVIDNGFDTDHEDLQANLLPGCDFHNRDNDPRAGASSDGHGTHVAGVAGAVGGNATGVVGVAPGGVKLLPLQALPDVGLGNVSNLIDAMLWAAGLEPEGFGVNPHPADIISISLGLDPKSASASQEQIRAMDETAKQVYEQGIFILAASGNAYKSDRIYAPANSPWVAAVGSVDSDYRRSDFSNYDTTGVSVDFVAPGGEEIGSLIGILSTDKQNGYGAKMGTSMATPFVAGAAALVLSQSPDLSPADLKKRLSDTAYFSSEMTEAEYGAGVICVDKALGTATQCGSR